MSNKAGYVKVPSRLHAYAAAVPTPARASAGKSLRTLRKEHVVDHHHIVTSRVDSAYEQDTVRNTDVETEVRVSLVEIVLSATGLAFWFMAILVGVHDFRLRCQQDVQASWRIWHFLHNVASGSLLVCCACLGLYIELRDALWLGFSSASSRGMFICGVAQKMYSCERALHSLLLASVGCFLAAAPGRDGSNSFEIFVADICHVLTLVGVALAVLRPCVRYSRFGQQRIALHIVESRQDVADCKRTSGTAKTNHEWYAQGPSVA